MTFKNDVDLQKFLKDKAFYRDNDCYCLGSTLEEAGAVVRKIVLASGNDERAATYVGMDIGDAQQSG